MKTCRDTFVVALFMLGCGSQSAAPVTPTRQSAAEPSSKASAVASTTQQSPSNVERTHAEMPNSAERDDAPPTSSSLPIATAGAPSSVSETALPKLGTIRGNIKTHPAQSAQHAVVYLENGPITSVIDAKLDDHKMTFFPYVATMTAGGTLTYVNSEPFPDTAFSMSNEKWDFGLVESHGVRKRKFEKPGVYTILCRLHPNQLAFLVVSPSSFVIRTDKAGDFVMPNVPEGTYELVAWAPRVKVEKKSVSVVGDAEMKVEFELRH